MKRESEIEKVQQLVFQRGLVETPSPEYSPTFHLPVPTSLLEVIRDRLIVSCESGHWIRITEHEDELYRDLDKAIEELEKILGLPEGAMSTS